MKSDPNIPFEVEIWCLVYGAAKKVMVEEESLRGREREREGERE